MRILFLSSRVPYPAVGGDRLRAFNFIKALSRRHAVTLLALHEKPLVREDLRGLEKYLEHCEVIPLPRSRSYWNCLTGLFSRKPLQVHCYQSADLRRRLHAHLKKQSFDLIFVHLLRMADYVCQVNNVPKILDLTDSLAMNYERSRRYEKEHRLNLFMLAQRLECARIRRYEARMVQCFDRNLLISPVDRDYLSQYAPVHNVEIIGPGVNLEYFNFYDGPYDRNDLVFVGKMSTFPNKDAVIYFCEKIFPLILRDFPDMRFTIVGIEPAPEILALHRHRNVVVTGPVQDVRPYLRGAALSVCPMRVGAGAKNKVLESMAIGTPVVATSIGIEGIDAHVGRDILVANEPQEFAENVRLLIKNPALRQIVAQRGRRLMQEKYSWDRVLERLQDIVAAHGQPHAVVTTAES